MLAITGESFSPHVFLKTSFLSSSVNSLTSSSTSNSSVSASSWSWIACCASNCFLFSSAMALIVDTILLMSLESALTESAVNSNFSNWLNCLLSMLLIFAGDSLVSHIHAMILNFCFPYLIQLLFRLAKIVK